MLNRLKEITLFKVKFPLNTRGVSYIILLHCFFPPVEKSLIHQGTYIMNVFFSQTGYVHNLISQTRANQLICSSVFSCLSLFGTIRNANTNTVN